MTRVNQLSKYKIYLEGKYRELVEKANDYKYEDECKSDRSAFKAMKVLEKINRIKYLNKDILNPIV